MAISTLLAGTAGRYLEFYWEYAVDKWNHLTPMQYGSLLIGVGLFGWILMKNTRR